MRISEWAMHLLDLGCCSFQNLSACFVIACFIIVIESNHRDVSIG
jgi:hypothetical protein